MRAKVLGPVELTVAGEVVGQAPGPVTALLQWFLLRPNERHDHETLCAWLWPDGTADDPETARERLYVVVSRFRAGDRDDRRQGLTGLRSASP